VTTENTFEKFIPSIEEDEKYFLAHVLKNIPDITLLDKNSFVDNNASEVYSTISNLITTFGLKSFTSDVLLSNNKNLNREYTESLFRIRFVNDRNYLNLVIKNIKDYKIKLKIGNTVEKWLVELTSTGDLNYNTIRNLADSIFNESLKLDSSNDLKSYQELTDTYKETIEQRILGQNIRSLGYKVLDKIIARPAAAGEMTTIFGMKGSGKSLFVKCIENMLINQNVCVLSINLEMTEESNMDRRVSIATNYTLQQLLDPNFLQSEENKNFITKNLEEFNKRKNYLYYSGAELSLKDLEKQIQNAKRYFQDSNVLPNDGYIFITIDLSEQLDELSGKSGTDLKPGVNKLLQLCKKYNCHIVNVLQSNENLFRGGRMFSTPEAIENFTLQPEMVEGGSVYAARSRCVIAINRPLVLKRRYFPAREEEWDIETDILWANIVKQNDGKLGRTSFVFAHDSFRLYPYKQQTTTNDENQETNNTVRRRS